MKGGISPDLAVRAEVDAKRALRNRAESAVQSEIVTDSQVLVAYKALTADN